MHLFQVPQLASSANVSHAPALHSFQRKHSFLHTLRPLALISSAATLIDLEGFSWTKATTRMTPCILAPSTGAWCRLSNLVWIQHICSLRLGTSPVAHLLDGW